MKHYILLILLLCATTAGFAAAPQQPDDKGGYGYKGTDASTGTAGLKALIVLVVLGAGAMYATHWLKKKGFSVPGQSLPLSAGNITEKKISIDKKIIRYESEGCDYILGVTKDNIILIDKIVRGPKKAKK